MRSTWLVLSWVLATMLWISAARADVIRPPPEQCPDGSRPTSTHAGPHCTPRDCENGEPCDEGLECQRVPLCVVERRFVSRAGPSSTRVIEGACPDGSCAAGECQQMPVCVANMGTRGQPAEPTPPPTPTPTSTARTEPTPASTASAEPTPVAVDETPPARTDSEPPSPPRNRGLGWWRLVPLVLAGLVLSVGTALALLRRRR